MNETDPRDYGEGKTPEQETADSMFVLAAGFFLIVIVAIAVAVILVVR